MQDVIPQLKLKNGTFGILLHFLGAPTIYFYKIGKILNIAINITI